MPISKSKRHSKYIGQFGEALVCNMLSRSGFEVMLVDHVGIDVIAQRSDVGRIGISVKSRTRGSKENEQSSVNLFRSEHGNLIEACKDFDLEPWIAVYVETESSADL
jgi:Holliday junction resolvase-like predicted endonuclease